MITISRKYSNRYIDSYSALVSIFVVGFTKCHNYITQKSLFSHLKSLTCLKLGIILPNGEKSELSKLSKPFVGALQNFTNFYFIFHTYTKVKY